jgi:hypothetical protein
MRMTPVAGLRQGSASVGVPEGLWEGSAFELQGNDPASRMPTNRVNVAAGAPATQFDGSQGDAALAKAKADRAAWFGGQRGGLVARQDAQHQTAMEQSRWGLMRGGATSQARREWAGREAAEQGRATMEAGAERQAGLVRRAQDVERDTAGMAAETARLATAATAETEAERLRLDAAKAQGDLAAKREGLTIEGAEAAGKLELGRGELKIRQQEQDRADKMAEAALELQRRPAAVAQMSDKDLREMIPEEDQRLAFALAGVGAEATDAELVRVFQQTTGQKADAQTVRRFQATYGALAAEMLRRGLAGTPQGARMEAEQRQGAAVAQRRAGGVAPRREF